MPQEPRICLEGWGWGLIMGGGPQPPVPGGVIPQLGSHPPARGWIPPEVRSTAQETQSLWGCLGWTGVNGVGVFCLSKGHPHPHLGSSGTSQTSKPHFHFYSCGWTQQLVWVSFLATAAHCLSLWQPQEARLCCHPALPAPSVRTGGEHGGQPGARPGTDLPQAPSPAVLRTACSDGKLRPQGTR